jgi:hypothetical protein
MKPPAEMHEGPEALTRFESTMQALFSKRKSDVLPEKQKKPAPKKKTRV